jgi:hypothetical protein
MFSILVLQLDMANAFNSSPATMLSILVLQLCFQF